MRLLAVCLDAAERSVVDEMVAAGDLPHIAELRRRGASSSLLRDSSYRAESAHIPLLTGGDPERLGYWGPNLFDPQTYECSVQGTYLGRPFYAGRDLRTIVFDVPQMSLAADVDGIQVSAWGAHSPMFPRTSSPPGLFDEITRRFGPHPAARSDNQISWYSERLMREMAEALIEGARRRAKIVRWLMEEHPDWELFLTAWGETHSAGHHYFHGIDPAHPLHDIPTAGLAADLFRQVYMAVDSALGEVLESVGDDTTVMAFAAHGMESNAGDVPALVLLPELLFRQHAGRPFMRLEQAAEGDAWLQLPPHRHVFEYLRQCVDVRPLLKARRGSVVERVATMAKYQLPPRVVSAARQVKGLVRERSLPAVWHQIDRRPFPEETREAGSAVPDIVPAGSLARWYRPFWPEMRAFALPSFSDAHFRINVEGREGSGIVPPSEFARACEELADDLRRVVDGRTGEPIVKDIVMHRGDDPFALPALDADLIVSFNAITDRIRHPDVGMVGPAPYMRPGEHSNHGWVVAAGAGIEAGRLADGDVADLTRTILALLGKDDADLIGRPLVGRPARI